MYFFCFNLDLLSFFCQRGPYRTGAGLYRYFFARVIGHPNTIQS